MKSIYKDITEYNLWANTKLVEFYLNQPEDYSEKTIVNSFPSVKLTFLHIWDAEVVWLSRLNGKPATAFPSRNFSGNSKEAMDLVLKKSAEFRDFVAEQTETFFEKETYYTNTKGGEYSNKNRQIIHHCMNHSTYHRGQLIMMARQLDLKDLPSTDYIFYLRR